MYQPKKKKEKKEITLTGSVTRQKPFGVNERSFFIHSHLRTAYCSTRLSIVQRWSKVELI